MRIVLYEKLQSTWLQNKSCKNHPENKTKKKQIKTQKNQKKRIIRRRRRKNPTNLFGLKRIETDENSRLRLRLKEPRMRSEDEKQSCNRAPITAKSNPADINQHLLNTPLLLLNTHKQSGKQEKKRKTSPLSFSLSLSSASSNRRRIGKNKAKRKKIGLQINGYRWPLVKTWQRKS